MNALWLYLRYISYDFRAQLTYKASFVMLLAACMLTTFTDFFAVYAFFLRFGGLGEWGFAQVCLFYGMTNMAFGLCEAWMHGFHVFQHMVQGGDFDRVLLRPRSTVLQVLGSQFQLMRVGKFALGLAVLLWAVDALDIRWTPGEWALLISSVLGGAALFSGIVLIQATSCFWTVQSLEMFNMLTYGGVETAQYPIDVYGDWLKTFFTRFIPLAAINYWPCSQLLHLGYVPPALAWLSPLFGPGLFLIGLVIWRFGVRRYRSTGS